MPAKSKLPPSKTSAFSEIGLKATAAALHEEIRELYTADDVPWIIGYSGGKDSTATLQIIWAAVAGLPKLLGVADARPALRFEGGDDMAGRKLMGTQGGAGCITCRSCRGTWRKS